MVNGKTAEEELERIDDFFDSLSVEEFEDIAIKAGAKPKKKRKKKENANDKMIKWLKML